MSYLTLMNHILIIGVLLTIMSCNPQTQQAISRKSEAPAIHTPATTAPTRAADEQAIKDVMAMQEVAWSAGDLDAFMQGYWKSEDLVFVGRSGPNYGWQTTLDNYRKGYPDLSAMGKLQFEVLRMTPIRDDAYTMIGKYTLIRAEDKPSGYFSLVWKKIDGHWVIVSDHTSG